MCVINLKATSMSGSWIQIVNLWLPERTGEEEVDRAKRGQIFGDGRKSNYGQWTHNAF